MPSTQARSSESLACTHKVTRIAGSAGRFSARCRQLNRLSRPIVGRPILKICMRPADTISAVKPDVIINDVNLLDRREGVTRVVRELMVEEQS